MAFTGVMTGHGLVRIMWETTVTTIDTELGFHKQILGFALALEMVLEQLLVE